MRPSGQQTKKNKVQKSANNPGRQTQKEKGLNLKANSTKRSTPRRNLPNPLAPIADPGTIAAGGAQNANGLTLLPRDLAIRGKTPNRRRLANGEVNIPDAS